MKHETLIIKPSKTIFYVNIILALMLFVVPPIGVVYLILMICIIPRYFFSQLTIINGIVTLKIGGISKVRSCSLQDITEVLAKKSALGTCGVLKLKVASRFLTLKLYPVADVYTVAAKIKQLQQGEIDNLVTKVSVENTTTVISNSIDQLSKLHELLKSGAVTEAEYQIAKDRLLK